MVEEDKDLFTNQLHSYLDALANITDIKLNAQSQSCGMQQDEEHSPHKQPNHNTVAFVQ